MVAALPGTWLKCSNFPAWQMGKKEKEMKGTGKDGKERRRERIQNRIVGRYIGTEEGIL